MNSLSAKDLYQYLVDLSNQLKASGQYQLAQNLYIASRFASGSTTELFGEARIALSRVLAEGDVADDERGRLQDILSRIDLEFERISRG